MTRKMKITGHVSKGYGVGTEFLRMEGYRQQFIRLIGIDPERGTLNLSVDTEVMDKLNDLESITIEGFIIDGVEYGSVKAYPAKIKGSRSAVILPQRSGHRKTLEIISEDHLRSTMDLQDGDEVELTVYSAQ